MKKLTFVLTFLTVCLLACTNQSSDTAISTATLSTSTSKPTLEPTVATLPDVATPSPTSTLLPSIGPGNGSFEDPFFPTILEGKEVVIKTYNLPKIEVEMTNRSIWVKLNQGLYTYTPYTINNVTDFMLIESDSPVGFTGVWRSQQGASFDYAHLYKTYTPTTDDLEINQYWETYVDKLKDLGLRKNENYYPDQHESPYQKCKIMLGNSRIVETWT